MPASASNANPKKRASAADRGRFPPTSRSTLLAAGLIVLADQASKALALRLLSDVPTVAILPGIFHLTLTINSGVAFGLFRGFGLAVTVLTLTLLGALVISSMRRGKADRPKGIRWGLILVVSGALGNLVDRVRFGGVVDFLDLRIWPIFNLADSCITVGAALMAWSLLFRKDASCTG